MLLILIERVFHAYIGKHVTFYICIRFSTQTMLKHTIDKSRNSVSWMTNDFTNDTVSYHQSDQ